MFLRSSRGCFGGYFRVFVAIGQYKGSKYSKHMVYCSMHRVYTSGKIGDFLVILGCFWCFGGVFGDVGPLLCIMVF